LLPFVFVSNASHFVEAMNLLAGFFPSVPVRPAGKQQNVMVNKREKTEGADSVPATAAPKRRTVSKPKAAARPAGTATSADAGKPAKAKAEKTHAASHEDVAFRAYLIAEKRQQLGIHGDSLSDWVEAERQLLGERATHGAN
jgi:hypothetical protein